jgi:tRNA nucleotidyltransferase (CCA-adding enzyme)
MNLLSSFFSICRTLTPIVYAIKEAAGVSYLVGGCVRDLVLGREIKDADVEVHGLTVEQLESILRKFGRVREVGKKFGVLRLDGLDVDWSLPRKDSKGRKPVVEIDPHMTIEEACRRRDLTMNAMALDLYDVCRKVETGVAIKNPVKDLCIIDPYGGLQDIATKQLQMVDEVLFLEDPLRFYRVMQFIGRFEMQPTLQLNKLCSTMKLWDEQTNAPISKERIFEEIKKLFLQSKRPSLGIRWLRDIGRLQEIFPELYALIGVPQRTDYHPEGDTFEHTMQTLDAAAQQNMYQTSENLSAEDEKFLIVLTMLVHDVGKAAATDAQLHCAGHDEVGVPLAEKVLKRITDNHFLLSAVKKLVRYHCMPVYLTNEGVSLKAYKRLATKLAPEVTLRHVSLVGMVDILGRNDKGPYPLAKPELEDHVNRVNLFCARAQEAQVAHGPEKPVLLGRHLLDVVAPGAELGQLLDRAYHIQIEESIKDWQVLKQRVLAEIKKPTDQ